MLVVTAAMCFLAQFIVSPKIRELRTAIGQPVQSLQPDDARRIAFGRLHTLSVALLALAMISALAYVILSLRAAQRPPESANG